MTKEFTFLFQNACEGLVAGGMAADAAEKLLLDLVGESECLFDATPDVPRVAISDYEYDLSRETIHALSTGGTNEGHAILLVAMLMAAVEDRVTRRMKLC